MAVSDGNIGFNDITQELYGRVPQAGDNLKQMFEDAPENGFDPEYDVPPALPGQAMSEFRNFIATGSTNGMWDSHVARWSPYNTDTYPQSYFSARGVEISTTTFLKKGSDSVEPFNGPVTASLTIGETVITTTDTLADISSVAYLTIPSTADLDDGVYTIASDFIVKLTDAGGNFINATVISAYPYLHIFGKGTGAYRWKWSDSQTVQYPPIYPQATWRDALSAQTNTYPGQNPPAVNVTFSDLAGFDDVSVTLVLESIKEGVTVGDSDNLIGRASGFVAGQAKSVSFQGDTLLAYQDTTSMIGKHWEPKITIHFSGGQLTSEVTKSNLTTNFFKVISETDNTFQWTWLELIEPTDDEQIDEPPVLDETRDTTTTVSTTTNETTTTVPEKVTEIKDTETFK